MLLETVLISAIVGGVTGIIAHLIRNKRVLIFPKKRTEPKGYDVGFIADFLIGAVAAVLATTYLFSPCNVTDLVGISILSGMAAENILLHREIKTERTKVDGLERVKKRLM
ncbi:DUF4257 domain-containing protein [Cytobacillus sp. Hm23]|uniref:DUF4257 domain-containing protein n=1 Tax=Cytobacillus sp. IB215665 TaxID=3097357 RepID=UPI002A0AD6F8|nr:DUF4257 domain-containing protein [Cytobacillus sp. IB215665]MDX8366968.1 DUF4257 domain-containing protein [Cytobacillus sp. IB215665]